MDFGGLKVLMISSDRNIFVPGSAVSLRMKEYGELVEELHIVVLSTKAHGLRKMELAKNVFVYPTNSMSRWFYPRHAARIGKKIVFNRKFVRGKSVITTQDPFECGLAGLKVKNKWRIPLQVQLHTDPFSPYFQGFLNRLRMRIARKVLVHADSIRCVQGQVAETIEREFQMERGRVEILPIYINREAIESKNLSFDLHGKFNWPFIILCVARLTQEKNVGFALYVLERVRERYPDTGLVIIGDGVEADTLRKQAHELKLERNIAFEGWQKDVVSYYRTANVFLQTSLYEGYGLALVEAGLSGLPVVTTPVGIALEFEHGKELYIYPHGDVERASQAIIELIENNHNRENLRINMKHTLGSRLLSKEDYLNAIRQGWETTAIKAGA